jgi:hypothetical protein
MKKILIPRFMKYYCEQKVSFRLVYSQIEFSRTQQDCSLFGSTLKVCCYQADFDHCFQRQNANVLFQDYS